MTGRHESSIYNALVLCIATPLVVGVTYEVITHGTVDVDALIGLPLIFSPLALIGLIAWHVVVWERRFHIRRGWVRFALRMLKAYWVCLFPYVLIGARRIPVQMAVPLAVAATMYATVRPQFAWREEGL